MRRLVIVSGTRPCAALDGDAMERIESHLWAARMCDAIMVHGDASGVDRHAAVCWPGQSIAMPAQWDKHGPAAGPKRNQAIVDMALAMHECGWDIFALCYPAPESKGTRDMIERLMWRRGTHILTAQRSPSVPFTRPMPTERWTVRVHELGGE